MQYCKGLVHNAFTEKPGWVGIGEPWNSVTSSRSVVQLLCMLLYIPRRFRFVQLNLDILNLRLRPCCSPGVYSLYQSEGDHPDSPILYPF